MRPIRLAIALGVVALLASAGLAEDAKPKPSAETALAEVRERWNKHAEVITIDGKSVGFGWAPSLFPHPTFKGGSEEAYGAFARTLVKFLEEKGNFDYLIENELLTAPMVYSKPQADWTFAKLIADFSQPKAFGAHDEATRKALKVYADKIAAAEAAPKASGLRDGKKLTFPAKGIPDGVKATLALLESCSSGDWAGPKAPALADLKRALEKDHIRLVFTVPVKVSVNNETLPISELVFDGGAFWIRSGDKILRRTKYVFEKEKAFEAWRNQGQTGQ